MPDVVAGSLGLAPVFKHNMQRSCLKYKPFNLWNSGLVMCSQTPELNNKRDKQSEE